MFKKFIVLCLALVLVSGMAVIPSAQEIKSDYPPTHLRSLIKTQVQDGLISQKPAKAGENGSGNQLTFSGGEKWYCAWSPDGRYIGFDQDGDICVINAETGSMLLNLTEEIDGYCYDVRFLPVGHSIMFTNYNFETGQSSVDFIDVGNHVVAANDAAYGIYCHKFQYLAYRIDSTSELALYDRAFDKPNIILAEGDFRYGSTCFSPDDTYVVTAMVTQDGSLKLFKIPVEGGEPEQLTFHSGEHNYPEISPDGKWMLYTVTDEFGMYVLYTYNMETGESMQVFPEAMYSNLMGRFSPEGDRFCYLLGDENGINQVFIADFPFEEQEASDKDTTPPAKVTDLKEISIKGSSVTINWTAPGDDENIGTAASYDIRYSRSFITEANWDDSTKVWKAEGEPKPQAAGSTEVLT